MTGMNFNMRNYYEMLREHNIHIIYTGPIWEDGIEGMSSAIRKVLSFDALSYTTAKSIFTVFVEQMNNMLMYAAEKERYQEDSENPVSLSRGIFMLGVQGRTYFLKCGNVMKNESVAMLKGRIDHLNSLSKTELREYYLEQIRGENNNPESRGAGLGLIEIAKRSSSKIGYSFEPYGENVSFFSMDVTIAEIEKTAPALQGEQGGKQYVF